jgi:ATP-dependent exoDNAse (exonuclease V) alpha subunit
MILTAKQATLPFTLRRVQFPLQLCFAMTVHKSQGQTLDRVGIYFSRRAWTHGLLYVAVSRVRRAADCFFVGRDGDSVDNCFSKSVL